ncbi:MAG: dihydrofolate reductase [Oscillibacter sp.]
MNAIVVATRNWAIGQENHLLFSLPTDMRRFRTLTTGATVLMGRKTLESFPGGKPLPKRRNVVLSSQDLAVEGAEFVHTQEELEALAASVENVFVIGGGSVYTALLARCKRVFLTRVELVVQEADTFFPNLDKLPGWVVESTGEPITENGITYRFVDYVNQNI